MTRLFALGRSKVSPDLVVLGVILLLAASFRLIGLNWDAGTHQHPDERFLTDVAGRVQIPSSLGEYFNTSHSPLNPYARGFNQYAYGQLPLTMTRAVGELTGFSAYDSIFLVGRALSVAVDLGTIVFAWLLARRVFGRRHAHVAALLLALTVAHIQLAHFLAVDTFVTFFVTAALFWTQRAWQRGSLGDAAIAGLLAGCAVASKVSAAALIPVALAVFVWPRRGSFNRGQALDGLAVFGVWLLALGIAFRVTEPYAFAGPSPWSLRPNTQWFADKGYWAEVSGGRIDVPYMVQWAGSAPYLFVLQAIIAWGMGPALGIAAFAGLALVSWRLVQDRPGAREGLLLVLWVGLNLAYFGGQFAKFLRYLLPIYPALAILAAYTILRLVDARAGAPRVVRGPVWPLARRIVGRAIAAGIVVATAGWALAFTEVYTRPHSRIEASNWIYDNIPPGKTLGVEHWDDRLPLGLGPERDGRLYRYAELTLYDVENDQKREKLVAALDQSDYIILASRRLADSIPRLPERYPLGTEYYRLLDSGQLGFDRAARIQVAPHIGPLVIDDSKAQEDFTVYDHPLVEVWAKRPDFSVAALRAQLDPVPVAQAIQVRPADAGRGALLLAPAERQAAVAAGTWRELFDRGGLANQVPLLLWLLTIEAAALSAFPLVWRSFPFLADRGFGASKILSLALLAYGPWALASLRLLPFGRGTVALTWLLMAAASGLVYWRNQGALRAWLVREKRLLLAVEGVFLAGFALFAWIRAANPDLWHPQYGGEKPMDFAFLNAVIKSDYFPPYDPWFAGGYINYYYYGFVLVAAVTKLTGIVPAVAVNLALPTMFGALVAGAFSLAFALSQPVRGAITRGPSYLAAGAAALLVGVLGNLDAGLQVLDQLGRIGGQVAPESGGPGRLLAGFAGLFRGQGFPPLDFWRSTRVIGPEEPGPISEFPYFSFLYGDPHAHVLTLPLTLAALAVTVNTVRHLRAHRGHLPWASIVWAAFVVGSLRPANTWDFPTYGAIVVSGLVVGLFPWLRRLDRGAIRSLVLGGAVFAVLSQLLFWPYLSRYQLFYTGIEPVRARTGLGQYLTIHGLLLFLVGSYLAWQGVRAWLAARRPSERAALVPRTGYYAVLLPPFLQWSSSRLGAAFATGVVLAVLLALAGYPTRGLIVFAMCSAGCIALATWRRADRAFVAGLACAALLLTLLPEFVALQGDIGRMNTVFKFYLQAWVLLAIAGAVGFGWLVRRSRRDAILRPTRVPWLAAAALLVLATASYPALASAEKIGKRFVSLPLSLDGARYMDVAQYRDNDRDLNLPADAAAIRWLQDNVDGSPTILEGRTPLYRWGSRVSIYTGLPTVLGWDWHEQQQRSGYGSMIQERSADVTRAYETATPAEALAILRKYDVRWVYVGGLERAYYSAPGLEKFDRLPQLRLRYDQAGVRIYEVAA